MKSILLLGLAAGALYAQNVQVYSEFAQLNDVGDVLAPANPREILSPAVARDAFSSFQIAIQVPKGTKFLVYVGQNPDDAAKVTLYRRRAGKLEPVELPYSGQSSQVLWMDLWFDAKAPARRVKIEPQVGVGGDWVTYPMEVRVMDPIVPGSLITTQGGTTPFEVMRAFLCGTKVRPVAGKDPVGAELIFRNVQNDVSLAALGSEALREEMKKAMGGCDANPPADPEFYLRLRDYLFTPLSKKVRFSAPPR
jgi:hypothetical protein